ncbi:hypothetical protein D0A37_07270 [Microcoleus vaginatus HSN003]|nr:hypothetical protein D0A37_07270 [Microcoleus vaginatus HSN003]
MPIEFPFSVFLFLLPFFYCAEFRRATQKNYQAQLKYLNHFIRPTGLAQRSVLLLTTVAAAA